MKNNVLAVLLSLVMVCGLFGGMTMQATAAMPIRGDADGNGSVNTTDARGVLQYAAGLIDGTTLTIIAADVDINGSVNTTDARKILQYAANLISGFPSVPTYSQFPTVPDYGAIYGVPVNHLSYEEGKMIVEYTYADDPEMKIQDALNGYARYLIECPFTPLSKFSEEYDYSKYDPETGVGPELWLDNRENTILIHIVFGEESWNLKVFSV